MLRMKAPKACTSQIETDEIFLDIWYNISINWTLDSTRMYKTRDSVGLVQIQVAQVVEAQRGRLLSPTLTWPPFHLLLATPTI